MHQPASRGALEPADRRDAFLRGAAIGAALAASTADCDTAAAVLARVGPHGVKTLASAGHRRAATALADELLAELTHGGVDLRRLAGRWVAWSKTDGFEADPLLTRALRHLDEFDAPITELGGGSVAAIAAALPAALASASPRAMIGGAFHVARMLDPSERTALCAVSIVVAAAELLEGHREFTAEVVAALRANDPPPDLLEALRSIPRDPSRPPPIPRGVNPDPVAVTSWVLWMVHHRPRGAEVLREMALAGGVAPPAGAIAGALLGARDGMRGWPDQWTRAQ